MNHLAFISYSHKYSSVAESLCNALEENGISCWIAPRDILSGDWAEAIMKGIASADIFIPVLGEHTINSVECLKELTEATRTCSYIIPFRIDDADLSPTMQYHLGPFHWVDASRPPLEQKIGELIQRIMHLSDEKSISLNQKRFRIIERIEYPKDLFVGRDSEIEQIAEHFMHKHVLFIQGIGGIGKSEIAKRYAGLFRTRYDTVVFVRYVSGLKELFCSDEIAIENLRRGEQETLDAWYKRKMNAFRSIADERTLLIIDNFDTDNDSCLDDLLSCSCHIMFTTRNNHDDYPVMHIGRINDTEQVRNIFRTYYGRPVKDWTDIDEILRLVNFHTMTVELIARQMKASFIKPGKMLQMLNDTGLNLPLKETIHMRGVTEKHNSYYYIRQLFAFENLSDDKKHILMCMSLIPPNGIDVTLLGQLLNLESYDMVNGLIDNSWLMLDTENDMLQLHPVIRDVIEHELKPDPYNCADYVKSLWSVLKESWWLTEDERNSYYPLLSHFLLLFPEPVKEFYTEYSDFVNICWMCGDYEKSKELGKRFYSFSCREYGSQSEQAALAALYLAGAYLNSGEDSHAEQWYRKSYEHYKACNAPVSPHYAQACFKTGRCESEHGNYDEAEKFFDESGKMYQKLIQEGDKYPAQYEDLKIAQERMLMMQGRYEEALALCRDIYDMILQISGEENTSSSYVLVDMGICCSKTGQYNKAEEYLNRAININIRNNGIRSMTTSYTREAIADHVFRTGDTKKAAELYSVLELDMERDLGSDNPHVKRIRQKRENAEKNI